MKNQTIKAALFDLDGVVVFTDKYHYLAWKKLSDENGWDFNEEINNRLRGIPRIASLEEILKHNNVELTSEKKELLANVKNEYYIELLQQLNETDIYNGVIEFISELKRKGVKISLCSSSKNAEFVLKKLGIEHLFDEMVTGKDIVNAKPDPEVFIKGSEKLGIPYFYCAVFEDAKVGILAAKSAKMRAIGVGNKAETEDIADDFLMDYSRVNVDYFIETGKLYPNVVSETALIESGYSKKEINHYESLFALGNGYIGWRGTYDEITENEICGMYINGVFATLPYKHIAKFRGFAENDQFTVNLPDWRIFTVTIDGETASFENENIFEHERKLEFFSGQLKRKFIFKTKSGKQAAIESCRLVNRFNVHGAEIKYSVTPINFSGNIVIKSTVVKNTKIRNGYYTEIENEEFDNGIYTILTKIPSTSQYASSSIALEIKANDYITKEINSINEYTVEVDLNATKNEQITIYKYATFCGSIDGVEDICTYTKDLVFKNKQSGFDVFINEQKQFWDNHWENADVKIKGNSSDQQVVRYSLFQLKQQLTTINKTSIGATGLTGPGYSGMVFWDTEMYLMPYYNFTAPETQKELLLYRYRILDKARERAKEFGTVGAMYSWCSIDGEETSVVFEASTAEYHLNSDIAYAIWRYVDTTLDKEFLYDYGAEIVFETAKFMSHRGSFVDTRGGKFCINAVCGPDEYACGVNNNFYTNLMVKRHLEYSLCVVEEMKEKALDKFNKLSDKISLTVSDVELWKKAAENMYLPYNEELDIFEQDDSYLYEDPVDMSQIPMYKDLRALYHPLDLWRLQVSKQADVCLAGFINGDFFTETQKHKCYDFYEPRCNHGSSLSPAIYSIVAAELNRVADAYEYFRCAAYMDIFDIKKNTSNGIHIACNGGVWMCVVNGYLGLRHYKNGISFKPTIPDNWQGYSCKISYRNTVIEINVDKTNSEFILSKGEEISFNVFDKKITLNKSNNTYNVKI